MQHANPASAAQHVQGYGRHGDTMLMHVSPSEVRGLQALAEAHGTTLTINPHTGMPEAFSLKKLLPTVLGIAGSFVGIPPMLTAALVGGVQGIATGSLKKGLMAGLGAYGGASLGGALSATTGIGAGAANAAGAAGAAGTAGAAGAAGTAGAAGATGAASAGTGLVPGVGHGLFSTAAPASTAASQAAAAKAASIASEIGANGALRVPSMGGVAGLVSRVSPTLGYNIGAAQAGFADAARAGLPTALKGGMIEKYAPTVAGLGVLSNVSSAMAPKMPTMQTTDSKWNYEGPYVPPIREVTYPRRGTTDSGEHLYFQDANPVPGYVPYRARQTVDLGTPPGYAGGGMHLEDGAFVVDARTVSELGNGSSSAGQDILRRMGGEPIKGHGDGVSDSIRANIGGRQEARVARDEVKFSPEAVKRIGGGSAKRGSDKLYSLMAKAEKARKTAKRGQDTGLASLLGAR